jgi:hypothetical protein
MLFSNMYLFVMLPNRERTCPVNLPPGVNVMGLLFLPIPIQAPQASLALLLVR